MEFSLRKVITCIMSCYIYVCQTFLKFDFPINTPAHNAQADQDQRGGGGKQSLKNGSQSSRQIKYESLFKHCKLTLYIFKTLSRTLNGLNHMALEHRLKSFINKSNHDNQIYYI